MSNTRPAPKPLEVVAAQIAAYEVKLASAKIVAAGIKKVELEAALVALKAFVDGLANEPVRTQNLVAAKLAAAMTIIETGVDAAAMKAALTKLQAEVTKLPVRQVVIGVALTVLAALAAAAIVAAAVAIALGVVSAAAPLAVVGAVVAASLTAKAAIAGSAVAAAAATAYGAQRGLFKTNASQTAAAAEMAKLNNAIEAPKSATPGAV